MTININPEQRVALEWLSEHPGPMPNTNRPSSMWSIMATCAATCAGWLLGRLTVPLPSLMRVVSLTRLAMNARQDGIVSQRSVECSPTKASLKPRRSARMIAARSSFSVPVTLRPGGCIGMVKNPSCIAVAPSAPSCARAVAGARGCRESPPAASVPSPVAGCICSARDRPGCRRRRAPC